MDPVSAAQKLVPLVERGPDATLVICCCVLVSFIAAFAWIFFRFWTSSIATIQSIQAANYQNMEQLCRQMIEQKHELISALKSNTEVIKSVLDNLKSNTDSLGRLSQEIAVLSDRNRTGRA
jgi:septal ring factor EnvC (AmiA/AmiB activator)